MTSRQILSLSSPAPEEWNAILYFREMISKFFINTSWKVDFPGAGTWSRRYPPFENFRLPACAFPLVRMLNFSKREIPPNFFYETENLIRGI